MKEIDAEFEAKFYPVNKKEIVARLQSAGAKLLAPERKMRRVIFDGREHPQFKCDYIRVRDEGGEVRLSAKVHAKAGGKIGDQKELDVIVSDFDDAIKILELAGLNKTRYQETLRETWDLGGAEVVIDLWPGLKPHIEIEADSEEAVRSAAEKLGLDWGTKIITSRVEIYAHEYNLSVEQVLEHMTNLTFENNPFTKQ